MLLVHPETVTAVPATNPVDATVIEPVAEDNVILLPPYVVLTVICLFTVLTDIT